MGWGSNCVDGQAPLLFAYVIGKDEVSLANYLSNTWGYCGFTEERLANGYSFLADKWTDDEQPLGFYHDYLAHVFEGHLPICFKVGWMFPFMYSTRIFIHTQVRSCLISSITKHRSKTQRMSCRQCLLPWCWSWVMWRSFGLSVESAESDWWWCSCSAGL